MVGERDGIDLDLVIEAVRDSTACDLSVYSERSLRRRIQKILDDVGLPLDRLVARIRCERGFGLEVVNRITVNTSELFRDPPVWTELRRQLIWRFRDRGPLTVWHAGCSKGQEVYSLLILLHELQMVEGIRCYASDLNGEVLREAKEGQYRYRLNMQYIDNYDRVINSDPLNYERLAEVSHETYFHVDRILDKITMRDFLRGMVTWQRSDLTRLLNPFGVAFDMIFCRNVLIYFTPAMQEKLLEFFHRHLKMGGALILGMREAVVGSAIGLFEREGGIYIRRE